jgi:hypothetical protein
MSLRPDDWEKTVRCKYMHHYVLNAIGCR